MTTLLVGHVTKEGTLAGPRTLEHVVDTVLSFDGERQHALRLLHALKHRFGPTHELGVFEMGEDGLADVPDASALFLADRRPGAIGSVVAPVLEGSRPLLVEVQALVDGEVPLPPRRVGQGIDANRLTLLLGGAEAAHGSGSLEVRRVREHRRRRAGRRSRRRPRVEPRGGERARGSAGSARHRRHRRDRPRWRGAGRLPRAGRRLAEAARLGFTRALAPRSTPAVPGIEVVGVADLAEALGAALRPEPRRHAA